MRVRSNSRFSRVISDAWSAGDGSGGDPGIAATRDRALPPRTAARQFRSIDGEIPSSVATCISGRPLLSSRATVSRLNSGENSLLVFGIAHPLALTGLAKVSTKSRDIRTIALHCIGSGKFTVLLEPGDGGRRTHMATLFAALSKRYRVCDYDRRNVGRSSSAPVPRKAADLMADAFDTLSAVDVKGPYILFGSSMGGLLVRSYAASEEVAGFVTSNQPGTTSEWAGLAYPLMSPSQRAMDEAWMAGDNNEHINVNDLSRAIDGGRTPSVPYVIMISTGQFQCKAAEICGPTYRAFAAASQKAARAGPRGSIRVLDGDHDLYVTNLADVVAAINEVALHTQQSEGTVSPDPRLESALQ